MKRVTCMLAALMLAVLAVVSPIATVTSHAEASGFRDYDMQYMSDGGLFDPIYYARNNPDVVAVMQTTDKNVLYQHYLNYGKVEGRQPYDPALQTEISPAPYSEIAGVVPNSVLYFLNGYHGDGSSYIWFMVDENNQLLAYNEHGQQIYTFAFDHMHINGFAPVYYTADKSVRLLICTNFFVLTVMDGGTPSAVYLNYQTIGRNARR